MWDVCVLGGGAAGLAAAITVKRENPDSRVLLLEKNDKLGKKIYATGNGRCNIGNMNGPELPLVLDFFNSLHLMLREEEEGRLYPHSEQAASVVEALEREIIDIGVHIETKEEAVEIRKDVDSFFIHTKTGGSFQAKILCLATGGKAAPQFGTTGEGYRMARELGHHIVRLAPVLMPICCEEEVSSLKGVRIKSKVSLWKKNRLITEEEGETQFTEDGLSGICIYNLSRLIRLEPGQNPREGFSQYRIMVDTVPEMGQGALQSYLSQRQSHLREGAARWLIHSIVPDKMISFIFEKSQLLPSLNVPTSQVSEEELQRLGKTLKELSFNVKDGKGWKFAQCTGGGVPLHELDSETMESLLVKNLFLVGEITDTDQPCGGYNLQVAWSQGMKAGVTIAGILKNKLLKTKG